MMNTMPPAPMMISVPTNVARSIDGLRDDLGMPALDLGNRCDAGFLASYLGELADAARAQRG